MKIIYTKNNENIVEFPTDLEEGKKRYNLLTADASVSNLSLITTIKEYTNNSPAPAVIIDDEDDDREGYDLYGNDTYIEEDSEY